MSWVGSVVETSMARPFWGDSTWLVWVERKQGPSLSPWPCPCCGKPPPCSGEFAGWSQAPDRSPPTTDPPAVTPASALVLATVGEEAVLVCEASGVPQPRVIWYRGASSLGGRGGSRTDLLGPWRISFLEHSLGGTLNGCLRIAGWCSTAQQMGAVYGVDPDLNSGSSE